MVCCCIPSVAQLQVWRHINTSDMANTNIICMAEDASGLIFDGRRFLQIKVPDQIQKGVNPFVNAMRWGRGGILWVATRTHIYTYNPANGAIKVLYGQPTVIDVSNIEVDTVRQQINIVNNDGISKYNITDSGLVTASKCKFPLATEIAMDSRGNVYALRGQKSIVMVTGESYKILYTSKFIRDIDYLPVHNALVSLTAEGLIRIDLKSGKTDTLPAKIEFDYEHPKTRVSVLADDQLLIHHPNGVCLLRKLDDPLTARYTYDEKNTASIQLNFINFSFSDRRKNIWISEDGISISVLPANSTHIRYISEKMTGASRLWLSWHDTVNHQVISSSEKGLCAIDYTRNEVSYKAGIKPGDSLPFFEVMYYIPWTKNELLLLTNGQWAWLFNTNTFRFRLFDTLNRELGKKSFWGGQNINENEHLIHGFHGLFHYKRHEGIVRQVLKNPLDVQEGNKGADPLKFYSSYVDGQKYIWFGSGAGVDVFDTGLRFVKSYRNDGKKRTGLGNTVILSMQRAADGDLYLATMGGGVYRLSPADTFVSVPIAGNLTNIYCIGVADKENLIITTSNGLCLYNTRTRESKVINENYGMPIADFNQYALTVDDKLLIASGAKGITIIDKDHLQDCFYDTAQILVMKGLSVVRNFTLDKGKQSLDFDVTIPGYVAQANWKVKYRLEGIDDDWREMSKGEWHIRYNSIKPGSYTLRVAATDAQNVIWAPPVAISIVALPYFWQTLWFRLLMVAIALGILVYTVRFFSQLQLKWKLKKLEDEQKVSRERMRISRELHDNVGSNLTYLISGLESSNILLQKHETETLEKKIEKMQSSARESMQQLRDSIWALNSETVAASVLASRFGAWVENIMEAFPAIQQTMHSELTADITLDPIRSLNLFRIMQEAVHNVIKHSTASKLNIDFVCNGTMIEIKIEDNGKGFDTEQKKGNGTKTMVSRAEEIGAHFSLVTAPGKGTQITIVVELR